MESSVVQGAQLCAAGTSVLLRAFAGENHPNGLEEDQQI
jgi:hypothetical protein